MICDNWIDGEIMAGDKTALAKLIFTKEYCTLQHAQAVAHF